MVRKIYVAKKSDNCVWIGVVPWVDRDCGYEFEVLPNSCKIQNIQWYSGDCEDIVAMIKRQIKNPGQQSEALKKLTLQVDKWFEIRQKHMIKCDSDNHIQYVIAKTLRSLESKPFTYIKLKPRLGTVKSKTLKGVKK